MTKRDVCAVKMNLHFVRTQYQPDNRDVAQEQHRAYVTSIGIGNEKSVAYLLGVTRG